MSNIRLTKTQALEIVKLLSAVESFALSLSKILPEHLQDKLTDLSNLIGDKITEDEDVPVMQGE